MAISLNTLGVAYYRVGNYEKALDDAPALGSDQQDPSTKAQSPPTSPSSP